MNCKHKLFMTKRKAFTLIELLIVIAIIGILFIVLVSKVDFATDKAKATGVQTDFRSFQLAFDTVAKENAGFNTFGWDTGDANQDRIRNSYDEGDNGAGGGIAKNGIQDGTEVFTGHKVYAETFTKVYSLKKNGTGSYDRDALNRLEAAINANLDPKLHITIKDDGEIVMANGAQDPWNKEYHGWYITNAEVDKQDRGAIVMYSDGANSEFGSEHKIANGIVSISIPGDNKYGKDDYAIVSCYTYVNGYGEVKNITTGFSNNTNFLNNSTNTSTNTPEASEGPNNPEINAPYDPSGGNNYLAIAPGLYEYGTNYGTMTLTWNELLSNGVLRVTEGRLYTSNSNALIGDLVLPNDGSITELGKYPTGAFEYCKQLTSVVIPEGITNLPSYTFQTCHGLTNVILPESLQTMDKYAFEYCIHVNALTIPPNMTSVPSDAFYGCHGLREIYNYSDLELNISELNIHGGKMYSSKEEGTLVNLDGFLFYKPDNKWILINYVGTDPVITTPTTINGENYDINEMAFWYLHHLTSVTISDGVQNVGSQIFYQCTNLQHVYIPDSVVEIGTSLFSGCELLTDVRLSASLNEIPNSTFTSCKSLTNIHVPDGVTTIGDYAFSGCSSITSLAMPSTVASIGKNAFAKCTSLETIVLHDNISSIDEYAFSETAIKTIILPNNLTSISSSLFSNCKQLTSVELGPMVTSIKSKVFSGCSSLQEITILSTTVPTQPTSSSERIPNTVTIHVPSELLESYKSNTQWSYLKNAMTSID